MLNYAKFLERVLNKGDYMNHTQIGVASQKNAVVAQFMSKVYLWMTVGILFTASIAYAVSSSTQILTFLLTKPILFYGLIIGELVLVVWLSRRIQTMSAAKATGLFLLYAGLNGVTLSLIAVAYTRSSIASAFFSTTFAFAGLSAFGYITKKDLGPVGSFCSMGLFGLIGFGLLSLFFPSMMGGMYGQIYGLVGIIVFAGLTAYDTQKIKEYCPSPRDEEGFHKASIMGALKLYLDFINLFLFILRMTSRRR